MSQAIHAAGRPVVLVGRSLGCLTVAWWAAMECQTWGGPVAGALLVAPPDLDVLKDARIAGDFNPRPRKLLPFPAILVARRDDQYASFGVQEAMSRAWGCHLFDAGEPGHLNAESGMVDWAEGKALLGRLVEVASRRAQAGALDVAQAVDDGHSTLNLLPITTNIGKLHASC